MKFFKRIYYSIPDYFKNRYWLTVILFICWMVFFDNNNFWSQVSLKFELNDLRNQKETVGMSNYKMQIIYLLHEKITRITLPAMLKTKFLNILQPNK